LLASRHNDLNNKLTSFSGPTSTAAEKAVGGACARELVIEEWRAIAQEFIKAGKCFFRDQYGEFTVSKFDWSSNYAVPVEVVAAQIFNLHNTPASAVPTCATPPVLGTTYDHSCLADASRTRLIQQRNIAGLNAADFAAWTQSEFYGLASVDDYVAKLNKPFNYNSAISPNLALGLHLSPANYAINFGFIENLLQAQSVRNATQSCLAFSRPVNRESEMSGFMTGGVNAITRVTTIKDLLSTFPTGNSAIGPGSFYDLSVSCP